MRDFTPLVPSTPWPGATGRRVEPFAHVVVVDWPTSPCRDCRAIDSGVGGRDAASGVRGSCKRAASILLTPPAARMSVPTHHQFRFCFRIPYSVPGAAL